MEGQYAARSRHAACRNTAPSAAVLVIMVLSTIQLSDCARQRSDIHVHAVPSRLHARGSGLLGSTRHLAENQPAPLGHSPPGPSRSFIPGYTVLRRVSGQQVGIAGDFYALEMQHKFPLAPKPEDYFGRFARDACYEVGRWHFPRPVDELYQPRHAPPSPLPGNVPRSYWQWDGMITRQQFDAVPEDMRSHCKFCHYATRYQIIDGRLYKKGDSSQWAAQPMWQKENMAAMEDLILHALYLFKLPDMDFIFHNGDGCPPNGWPLLSWTICRDRPQAGFAFPMYTIWTDALGTAQNKGYHECMATRYNASARTPVVFWRGSNTDPFFGASLSYEVVDKIARIQAHKKLADDPAFDAKLTEIQQNDLRLKMYVGPLAKGVPMEEYAKSAVSMDFDGHGASFRFGHIFVHLGVPVLKQATNRTTYFEHLAAPGHMITYFKGDLSDVQEVGRQLVNEWRTNPARLIRQGEQLQGLAAAFMHTTAVVEAAAYALLEYSKKLTWKTVRDTKFTQVPWSQACTPEGINRTPREICKRIWALT